VRASDLDAQGYLGGRPILHGSPIDEQRTQWVYMLRDSNGRRRSGAAAVRTVAIAPRNTRQCGRRALSVIALCSLIIGNCHARIARAKIALRIKV